MSAWQVRRCAPSTRLVTLWALTRVAGVGCWCGLFVGCCWCGVLVWCVAVAALLRRVSTKTKAAQAKEAKGKGKQATRDHDSYMPETCLDDNVPVRACASETRRAS